MEIKALNSNSMGLIITLTTDFGTRDGFVGAMKGVILSRAPKVQIVDITHDIPHFQVHAAAWALREFAAFFPKGTIHVVVVDPGVGTPRNPLLIKSHDHFFIGPDNGVLTLAARHECSGWILNRREWFLQNLSTTFHGRDIFAAVAGHLAQGVAPQALGTQTDSWIHLNESEAKCAADRIEGQVIHVDQFGNLITNIHRRLLTSSSDWRVVFDGDCLGGLRGTFGDVPVGAWVSYIGSSGFVEIAIREGRASKDLGALGKKVTLCKK